MDRSKLPDVADVYMSAAREGNWIAVAVADHFGVSMRTAGNWIAHAKTAGLIPEGVPKFNKDALAVSRALGITYEELHGAIMDHAGGYIRLTAKRKETK